MSDARDIVRNSQKYNNRIKKICDPLFRHLGFNGIFYHHISNDGLATSLGSDAQSFEYFCYSDSYHSNPFIRHPDFFQTSMHLIPDVQNASYQDSILTEAEKFDVFYKIIFLEKTKDGCHGFSFATPKACPLNLNDLSLLHCFIKFFKREAADILRSILGEQLQAEQYLGKQFFEDPISAFAQRQNDAKFEFLKKLGIINSKRELELTSRETDCMRLVLQGYSAGQVAEILNLSKRTVEHYIDNIKLKSNCDTKAQLITKFREIENLGLLF